MGMNKIIADSYLTERARGELLLHQYLLVALVAGKDPRHSFAHALDHLCMRWHMLNLPTLRHRYPLYVNKLGYLFYSYAA